MIILSGEQYSVSLVDGTFPEIPARGSAGKQVPVV